MSRLHKLTVRQKPESIKKGQISTGANTEVLLDNKELKGVSFIKFEFKSRKTTKVCLEIYASIDKVEGNFENLNPLVKIQTGGMDLEPQDLPKEAV